MHGRDDLVALARLAAEWDAKYPLFGAGTAVELYSCTPWEADRTPLPERDAEGSAPIMVIGTEGDPATPLEGAVDMAADLENAVLLTWQGEGHTAYPKTDCVTDAVNAYLLQGVAPADDLITLRKPRADGATKGGVLVVGVESLLTSLARCCTAAMWSL